MGKKVSLPVLLAAAALALHLFAGLAFIRSAAATYDETVHLASGFSYLHTGRYVMNIMDHPPFSEMLSALAVLPLKPQAFTAHPYFSNYLPYHYGDLFLYRNTVPPDRLLNAARTFTFLVWTALLAGLLWLFVARLESRPAAAFALCAFAGMPVFISNDALVSTDAAAAVFYFASFALAWLFTAEPAGGKGERPGRPWLWAALAGAASGLALVSKFSMFVVPPMVAAFWIADNRFWPKRRFSSLLPYLLLYAAACLLAVALVYKFDLGLFWNGLSATLKRLDEGRSSFALGRHSVKGVWWYFPAALALKTPLAVLLAAAGGAWLALKGMRRDYLWLLVPPAVFFAASLTAKVQIGYRHIMPVMPFLAASAGIGLGRLYAARRGALVVLPLLALNAASTLRAHPHYLAYFNELAGGPANGYKYFTDSNLDWGQGVKQLAEYLKTRGNPPVIFAYFGVARPEAYGVSYAPLGLVSNAELRGTGAQVCGMKETLLAVSATNLQGTYYPDKKTFDWLKARTPAYTAGYSIFVYDLTRDADGLRRLGELFDREGRNAEADCLYARAGN